LPAVDQIHRGPDLAHAATNLQSVLLGQVGNEHDLIGVEDIRRETVRLDLARRNIRRRCSSVHKRVRDRCCRSRACSIGRRFGSCDTTTATTATTTTTTTGTAVAVSKRRVRVQSRVSILFVEAFRDRGRLREPDLWFFDVAEVLGNDEDRLGKVEGNPFILLLETVMQHPPERAAFRPASLGAERNCGHRGMMASRETEHEPHPWGVEKALAYHP